MQEEVNEKTISLCIKGGKISGNILKAALKKLVSEMEKKKQKSQAQKESGQTTNRGKQSLKKMMKDGSQLSNIEIADNNIKSFERVARKYSIDYSLKKDSSTEPPRYMVFFRAKDVDVMTAAFKEYAGISAQKQKKPKMSIRKKLQIAKDRAAQHREREKDKSKDRGQSL
ncbi:MAG: PcfB family protein [Lachnospiraceae bacterium]|nr:PcfB family protein [Lachnospiraceae bacterium]